MRAERMAAQIELAAGRVSCERSAQRLNVAVVAASEAQQCQALQLGVVAGQPDAQVLDARRSHRAPRHAVLSGCVGRRMRLLLRTVTAPTRSVLLLLLQLLLLLLLLL
jgi:hypothetical protein